MVFGLVGHKTAEEKGRNRYTSLKKNVKQLRASSLAMDQRNSQTNEIRTTDQLNSGMDSPLLDSIVEQSISKKIPVKVKVNVKIVPEQPNSKNKTNERIRFDNNQN